MTRFLLLWVLVSLQIPTFAENKKPAPKKEAQRPTPEQEKERWKKLIPSLQAKVQKSPQDGRAHFLLGKAFYMAGDLDQAIGPLKDSLKTFNSEHYKLLAKVYEDKKDYLESIRVLELLIASTPRDAEAYAQLGNAYFKTRKPQEAIKRYLKAIEIQKKYRKAYVSLLEVYDFLKNYYEARTLLTDMLNVFGQDPFVLAELCRLNTIENYLEPASESCRKAIEADSQNPNNHAYFGKALKALKNPNADKIIFKAAEQFPKSEFAQWQAAQLFFDSKNYEKSLRAYEKTTIADPQSLRGWLGYARSAFELKNYEKGFEGFKKACELDQQTATEFSKFASVLRKQMVEEWANKYKGAADSCKRARVNNQ